MFTVKMSQITINSESIQAYTVKKDRPCVISFTLYIDILPKLVTNHLIAENFNQFKINMKEHVRVYFSFQHEMFSQADRSKK